MVPSTAPNIPQAEDDSGRYSLRWFPPPASIIPRGNNESPFALLSAPYAARRPDICGADRSAVLGFTCCGFRPLHAGPPSVRVARNDRFPLNSGALTSGAPTPPGRRPPRLLNLRRHQRNRAQQLDSCRTVQRSIGGTGGARCQCNQKRPPIPEPPATPSPLEAAKDAPDPNPSPSTMRKNATQEAPDTGRPAAEPPHVAAGQAAISDRAAAQKLPPVNHFRCTLRDDGCVRTYTDAAGKAKIAIYWTALSGAHAVDLKHPSTRSIRREV